MEFQQRYNQTRFMAFVPKIRKNVNDWRIIEVTLTGKTNHNVFYISKKLMAHFHDLDGIIFICNSKEILVLVHTGADAQIQHLSSQINDNLPQYSCRAEATDITAEGLLKFQIRLNDLENEKKETSSSNPLQGIRQARAEKTVMVIDDDKFMRSAIAKTFQRLGQVIEEGDTENIVETYLETLPDIVFLDIHLPSGSGIDVLSEIVSFDDTAHVIILSSDSVKDNVLKAKQLGAKGFVVKPFSPEKIEACYDKCPTMAEWRKLKQKA